MQRYELDAWLGDDHGLTEEQLSDLLWQADEIELAYPDPDDEDERTAALTVAYRIISGEEGVVEELARARAQAKAAEIRALAGLKRAAIIQVSGIGTESEAGFARRANVDRMAVRSWLGKRGKH
ncbi:hypothetical protein [Streptomyces sp. NPDC015130]|uniref:hypothetical protein n=1 Tax=Streptomyces sp. NPDC015130 TaxID=3364940 RepID=UPI0036FDC0F4